MSRVDRLMDFSLSWPLLIKPPNRPGITAFWTIRCTPPIWEENEGASYSLNVAHPACWGGGAVERGFFPLFSSSKT